MKAPWKKHDRGEYISGSNTEHKWRVKVSNGRKYIMLAHTVIKSYTVHILNRKLTITTVCLSLICRKAQCLIWHPLTRTQSYFRTQTDFGRTSWVTLKSSQKFPNLESPCIPEKVIIILTWSSYLFYISLQQPNFFSATVQLLIHEALISSLFNFVLNRLTGMITTRAVALRSHATPVCYNKGASCD